MKSNHSSTFAGVISIGLIQALIGNPVDFTTDFTLDTPLNGQNNWVAQSDDMLVTASGVNSGDGYDHAIFSNASSPVNPGDSFTSTINFTYTVEADTAAVGPLVNATIANGADPLAATRLTGVVGRANNGVRIYLYQDWGQLTPIENGVETFAQSEIAEDTLLGLDPFGADELEVDGDEDLVSDELEVSLTLTAGFSQDDWSALVSLRNLTTDTVLLSHQRTNITLDAVQGNSVFGGIGTGQSDLVTATTDRNISRWEFNSTPLSSGTENSEFTIAEGYSDGPLFNHPNWNSNNAADVIADPGLVETDGFVIAIVKPGSGIYMDQATYKSSIVFSFQDNAVYTPPFELGDQILDVEPPFKPLINTAIHNQPDPAQTGSQFTIDTSEMDSGVVTITTLNPHGLQEGETIILQDIEFEETDPNGTFEIETTPSETTFTYETDGDNETFTELTGTGTKTGSPQLRASLNRLGAQYTLQLQTSWNGFPNTFNRLPYFDGFEGTVGELRSFPIDAIDVGIDRDFLTVEEADLVSDKLKLCLTLTAGETNDRWDATMELFNLDSPTPDEPLESTFLEGITSFEASNLFGGFGTGQSDANAAISARDIQSHEFAVEYPIDTTEGDLLVTSSTFDGTTLSLTFTGTPETNYALTQSSDLEGVFSNTTGSSTTDENGSGELSYTVPSPAALKNFFRLEKN